MTELQLLPLKKISVMCFLFTQTKTVIHVYASRTMFFIHPVQFLHIHACYWSGVCVGLWMLPSKTQCRHVTLTLPSVTLPSLFSQTWPSWTGIVRSSSDKVKYLPISQQRYFHCLTLFPSYLNIPEAWWSTLRPTVSLPTQMIWKAGSVQWGSARLSSSCWRLVAKSQRALFAEM